MAFRRSPTEICFHIMKVLRDLGPTLPTHLMFKANLGWSMMTEHYLPELFQSDIIGKMDTGHLFLKAKGLEAVGVTGHRSAPSPLS